MIRPRVLSYFALTADGKISTGGRKMAAADHTILDEALIEKYRETGCSLAKMLNDLRRKHGVRTLLCEGGLDLLRTLLEEDLVDEMFLTIAPVILGGKEAPTLTGLPGAFLPATREFRLKSFTVTDDECHTHYVRRCSRGVSK